MEGIRTGKGRPDTLSESLRWAAFGDYRVVAYAEGGYSVQHRIPGMGWCLSKSGIPAHVERALCAALAISCDLDDAWTVADILAREG